MTPPTSRGDGHDLALAAASAGPAGWTVTVEADRTYFDAVVARQGPDVDTVAFPTSYPRRVVVLSGDEVRIGRRRVTGGGPDPDVDLSGPPLDPGVSHRHAVLLPDGEGGWNLLDPGSTNGTTVNGAERTIPVDTLVPLRPGDRVHVGAYTTLVVARTED